jgi:hypothetical protein
MITRPDDTLAVRDVTVCDGAVGGSAFKGREICRALPCRCRVMAQSSSEACLMAATCCAGGPGALLGSGRCGVVLVLTAMGTSCTPSSQLPARVLGPDPYVNET